MKQKYILLFAIIIFSFKNLAIGLVIRIINVFIQNLLIDKTTFRLQEFINAASLLTNLQAYTGFQNQIMCGREQQYNELQKQILYLIVTKLICNLCKRILDKQKSKYDKRFKQDVKNASLILMIRRSLG